MAKDKSAHKHRGSSDDSSDDSEVAYERRRRSTSKGVHREHKHSKSSIRLRRHRRTTPKGSRSIDNYTPSRNCVDVPGQCPTETGDRDDITPMSQRPREVLTPVISEVRNKHQQPVDTTQCDSTNFVDMFKDLIQSLRSDGNTDRYPNINVLPEFDPSKRTQTIDMWIQKVNECAKIYNWSERQIIHYALPKLVGLAQKWYQGLPTLLFNWDEWQFKLRSAFPSDENYGQLLTEMLACKARFGDSLEEYFYEKTVLLNRCNINGKNAIDCILFGIDDRSVRTSAEAAQFTEPDKLLVYLRNVKKLTIVL